MYQGASTNKFVVVSSCFRKTKAFLKRLMLSGRSLLSLRKAGSIHTSMTMLMVSRIQWY